MTPIPSEPLEPSRHELQTSDGRRFKLKVPGLDPPAEENATEERAAAEPPRDDPRGPANPNHVGP